MRTSLACLALVVGCSGPVATNIQTSRELCSTPDEEVWVLVATPAEEAVVSRTRVEPDGCTSVLTTYYFAVPSGGSSHGPGSGLPWWYYALGCQWDACDGPLDPRRDQATNPSTP